MEENKFQYSFTQLLKNPPPPKKPTKILLEIFFQLNSLKLKHLTCSNILLQFISLLFFSPKSIPFSNDERFTNWKEVYDYYGNPERIFLSIEDKLIPTSIKSLFLNKNHNQDDKLVADWLNTIDWGTTADYLSKNYRWLNDYYDLETNETDLITLEIFDTIAASLKRDESSSKNLWGEVYTPYRFAAYIAKESLIHWLNSCFQGNKHINLLNQNVSELDEESKSLLLNKLESIKILDPAAGTGVFLLAAAKLLLKKLKELQPNGSTQNLKTQILERNLFGVDIDIFAVTISLMKFWLWAWDHKDLHSFVQISFKYNFYEGNALLGFQNMPTDYRKNNLAKQQLEKQKSLLDYQYDQKNLNQFAIYKVSNHQSSIQGLNQLFKFAQSLIKHHSFKYFILEGDRVLWNSEKDSLNKNVLKKTRFSASNSCSSNYNLYAVFSPSLNAKEEETITSTLLECKKYSIPKKFHWIYFGPYTPKFDLIIGNPPFVALTDMTMISRKMLRREYPNIYTGNNDLSYFFITRALSALRTDNGILSFILPKYLLHSVYARKIRNLIVRSAKILEIHDLAEFALFKNTSIKNIILHLKRGRIRSNDIFIYYKYRKKKSQAYREVCNIQQSNLKSEKWILLDPPKLNLLNRIRKNSNMRLKDVAYISKGIETGCDRIFAPKEPFYFSRILKVNQIHIKPWIKGKDIKRFSISSTGREVLFAPCYRKHEIIANKKILNYLKQNKKLLLNRSRVFKFYLWRSGDERKTMKWDTRKIVSPYKATQNTFAIDLKGSLSSKDVVWIIPNEKFSKKDFILFLVAILNSEVLTFFALNSIKDLGGLYEYYPKQIQDFPLVIPKFNTPEYKSICDLTSKILKSQNDIKKMKSERRLNEIIFKLYCLSQEEIDLLEECNHQCFQK